MPHCTSSKTSAAPRAVQRSRSASRNARVAGTAPPSPCTGSTSTVSTSASSTSSSASTRLNSAKRTPGTSGSKGSRYAGVQVAESEKAVRPWKPPRKASTAPRDAPPVVPGPRERAQTRANFSAASTPSVPLLQKNTRG